jgi:hypothetical protein
MWVHCAAFLLILAGLVNFFHLWQRDRDRERTERERRPEGL